MSPTPQDWNVVVVGAWNTAILTPEGIKTFLYKLDAGKAIAVEVSLNAPVPMRVKHEGLSVAASADRIIVAPEAPTFGALRRAVGVARNALEALPRTPFAAAGLNIRYSLAEMPSYLSERTNSKIQDAIASNYQIAGQSWIWSLGPYDGELLNVKIERQANQHVAFELNFHYPSTKGEELQRWCETVCDRAPGRLREIANVVGLPLEEA